MTTRTPLLLAVALAAFGGATCSQHSDPTPSLPPGDSRTAPTPTPIDPVQHSSLPATLVAAVRDSVVTLTFTVTNNTTASVRVTFNSAQQVEFVASASPAAAPVWRSSDEMSYAQMLTDTVLAPGGTLANVATWHAPQGSWVVTARLTSSSHQAEASSPVTVP